MTPSSRLSPTREINRIIGYYILFGSAWIYLSDNLVSLLITDPVVRTRIEVFKGLLFIVLTTALLHKLIGSFARRNAETIRRLAQSEARFQTIYHHVNDALIIHDSATGKIVDVNRTMCNMFGYSREEALQLQVQEISLGEPPFSQAEGMFRLGLASKGVPQLFEWRSRKKDGALFWSEVNMRCATINGEERVIVMVRDATARKQAEDALRQNEESLKALMEEMPAGVCWTSRTGVIEYLNGSIVEWFGYTRGDISSIKDWMQRALPDQELRDRIRDTLDRLTEEEGKSGRPARPIEATVTCKDGSKKHVILNIRLVHNRVLYIFTDITEREAIQQERLKTQKLESLGVLAGGIAHDFNNILTGILGNISFMGMILDETHPACRPLAQAEKASLRAAELAHQLLTFAKGGEPVKKVVAVGALVQESLSLALRGSRVKCTVEIPDDLQSIEADEGQMNQAFNNVIINALQAMPQGGTLTVKGENVTREGDAAELADSRYVRLTFTDEGCGIAEADLQRIFDPYFTTKADGSGLGLASVHSIIAKHSGRIEVTSTPGRGTTFTIWLPSAGEAPTEPECEPARLPEGQQDKGAILVMDDEEMILLLARNMLQYLGYRVTTCSSGEEAVRLYKEAAESGAPFMAAIMDLTVPAGMGGREAAQQILAYDRHARLIVSSGYSNDPVMAKHTEYGFSAAITKPYRCAEVVQALKATEDSDQQAK